MMMRILRRLLAGAALAVALLLGAAATLNLVHAETWGTAPLERLARRGPALERAVAGAVADSLAARPYTREWKWYGRYERSADGDTLLLRLYRAQDARLTGRMIRPEPHINGGAKYIVSQRRFKSIAIGVE